MTDEDEQQNNENNDGSGGADQFDPKALSSEAQEYIRRTIQSESDRKGAEAERRLQAKSEAERRAAEQTQRDTELQRMAAEGDFEGLGKRVADQLSTRTVELDAIRRASDAIEEEMKAQFTDVLGADKVEEIRQRVISEKGAHAEFARALAEETANKTRADTVQAEVKAQLIELGLAKREELGGADKAVTKGKGPKPTTFEEIETAYGRGEVSTAVYEEARKNR